MTPKEECSDQWKMSSTKHATIVEKKATSLPIAPSRTRERRTTKSKHCHDSSDDEEDEKKNKNKKLGKKKSHDKKTNSSQRRKGTPREASWWKNKNR